MDKKQLEIIDAKVELNKNILEKKKNAVFGLGVVALAYFALTRSMEGLSKLDYYIATFLMVGALLVYASWIRPLARENISLSEKKLRLLKNET